MPFCTQCGTGLDTGDRFCRECGAPVRAATSHPSQPPAPARFAPASQPRADVRLEGSPRRDERDEPHGTLLGPSAAQNPLSFVAPPEPTGARRPLVIAGCLVIVAATGLASYFWFRPAASVDRRVAVESTEQALEPMAGTPPAQPLASTDRSAAASSVEGRPHADAPRRGEPSNLIAGFTKEATDATSVLGAPDGRAAVIAPGGSVAVSWADGPFYNGHGPDIRVYAPAGHRVSYTIFARMASEDAWVRFDINRRGFANGTASHDFGHHGITRAQQIMIRNEGASPLYVDAVSALYLQPEDHGDDEPAGHRPAPRPHFE